MNGYGMIPAPGGAPPLALPLSVWVAGRARTKGSMRVRGHRANGSAILAEQVAGSKPWREQVVETILRQGGAVFAPGGPSVPWVSWGGPVAVRLLVWLPRPTSGIGATSTWPTRQCDGDSDKYQRNIGDALEDTRIIGNDAQIVHWEAWKMWADPAVGRQSGVQIDVTVL
jgi:hypothetical protein